MKSRIKRIIPTALGLQFGDFKISFPSYNGNFENIPNIIAFVKEILNSVITLSAVVAVALIIYSGILYMTAAGDSEKVSSAQKALTAAVVGMVIVFIARMLIVFILEAFLK